MSLRRRAASHANSWYSGDRAELNSEIGGLIAQGAANALPTQRALQGCVKAVISPHAGLSYSGPTASVAYAKLAKSLVGVERVFVLGPCHCDYFTDIRLSQFDVFEGPIQDVAVDQDVNKALKAAGDKQGLAVGYLDKGTDTDEHSIELQMPFLSYVLKEAESSAKIIPIVMGHFDADQAARYGKLLAPFYQDPATRFVISSDFCHWGSRFRYTHHYKKAEYANVGDSIIAMDHEGMRLIEEKNRAGFDKYLSSTGNTICGRVPIAVLLEAMEEAKTGGEIDFVHYSQSSKCKSTADSSVSYASAVVTM